MKKYIGTKTLNAEPMTKARLMTVLYCVVE